MTIGLPLQGHGGATAAWAARFDVGDVVPRRGERQSP